MVLKKSLKIKRTYNTTNVTHNRSSATMPKPIDMGY